MSRYDEPLRQLRQQVSRKQHLTAALRSLTAQQRELEEKVRVLDAIRLDEQADVDRLESRSLAAFFYNVVGKMDEKLSQERQEAYAAAVKYDAARRELEAVEQDMRRYRAELMELSDCEARYDRLLAEKQAEMCSAGGHWAEKIRSIESQISQSEHQMDEIDEAIAAGNRALSVAEQVMSSLGSAGSWSTLDLFSDGLLTDMAKYHHLDHAQREVEQLQVELRRFNTELADVDTIRADIQVSIDGSLRFADCFFDNLFTDWAVKNRIDRSREQVQDVISQIRHVVGRLEQLMDDSQSRWKQLHDELDALVLNAQI